MLKKLGMCIGFKGRVRDVLIAFTAADDAFGLEW
jgi:hypothetical protein